MAHPPSMLKTTTSTGSTSSQNDRQETQRKTSVDSTLSSLCSPTDTAQKFKQLTAERDQIEKVHTFNVAAYIESIGSAETAVAKLMHEKAQTASHNAQLWRLVEKQRAMILGLNKDLEKSLKEKEKYRKRLKNQAESDGRDKLRTSDVESHALETDGVGATPGQNHGKGNRSEHGVSSRSVNLQQGGPGAFDRPREPQAGQSRSSGAMLSASQLHSTPTASENSSLGKLPSSDHVIAHAQTSTAIRTIDQPIATMPASLVSSPRSLNRKAPPAPLFLQPGPVLAVTRPESSGSEYEDDPETARNEQVIRGRRKTREDDDRQRELQALDEPEGRSSSRRERSTKTNSAKPQLSSNGELQTAMLLSSNAYVQEAGTIASRSIIVPQLLSPGLPMSPRPGDRPLNSPMPRAPNSSFRLAKPTMTSKITSLVTPAYTTVPVEKRDRNETFHTSVGKDDTHENTRSESQDDEISSKPALGSIGREEVRTNSSSDSAYFPNTAWINCIAYGIASEQFPNLLVAPTSMLSIAVKTASSRLQQRRPVQGLSRSSEDSAVLLLAVHSRSDNRTLWQVEKSLHSLAAFDTQIKILSNFRHKFPEKSLFTRHAPAKIDARKLAIEDYFDTLMNFNLDDKARIAVCTFFSNDVVDHGLPSRTESRTSSRSRQISGHNPLHQHHKSGYLTKRGKNFGGWKARYFVLDSPTLRYFETPQGAHLGSINLVNAQIGRQTQQSSTAQQDDGDGQFRHAFLVLEPKKKDSSSLIRHILCAENDDERDAWVKALLYYVEVADTEHAQNQTLAPQPTFATLCDDEQQSSLLHDTKRLVAVSYDGTIAGQAPQIGTSYNNGDSLGIQVAGSDATGPAAAHDSDDAYLRTPASPTSKEAIKDKKRGMFAAFRGRTSSDLTAGKDHVGMVVHTSPRGPAFGSSLAEVTTASFQLAGQDEEIPLVVYRCLQYLVYKNAKMEEGIFRLSGSNSVIKSLKERFNNEGDINLVEQDGAHDVHAIASLLKLYLRELPSSILTRELHLHFLQCLELSHHEKLASLHKLIFLLPVRHRKLLGALSSFLRSIVDQADTNKMNLRNVAIVFAPTLNIPGPLITLFIENYSTMFETRPDTSTTMSSPAINIPSQQATDLRSPRKQMFSELSSPSYNQTSFAILEPGMTVLDAARKS